MKLKNDLKFFKYFFLIGSFVFPFFSFAASFYFSPSSGSYNVGQNFTIDILVESEDYVMNAVSGIINFSNDKLEVVSLSKNGSILNFWVQEPSFSNQTGKINFEGVVFNPGFQGRAGKVLSINFKTKSSGQANLNFELGSILANDGEGTNILKGFNNASFNLILQEKLAPSQQIISLTLPPKPEIYSLTHQNQNQWYANNNLVLKWNLPRDIIALKYSLTQKDVGDPNILVDFPFNSKEYKNLEDGIWYFNLQFKNQKGWGEINHYRLQIDTIPPEIKSFELVDGSKTRKNNPEILINAIDNMSGIDFYEFKIEGEDFYKVLPEDIKNNIYILPYQNIGKKVLLVKIYDKAGNYSLAKTEFEILPQPTWLEILFKEISITLIYLIPLIALIILLIILLLYGIRYIILLRKKIKKDKQFSFQELHKIFEKLKDDIEIRIKTIKNVKNKEIFTKEEKEVIRILEEDLEKTENIIKKDLTKIFDDLSKN
ncbi:MAG: cohesin domain-containing protein [Patescibacteria group bacterium]|nr:cohesin domain-containing protein [Patescibacteria group bacterium]MDW8279981.1 cohesin domain-containing protein [bacterium]